MSSWRCVFWILVGLPWALIQGDSPTLRIPEVSFEEVRFSLGEDEVKIVEKLIAVTEAQLQKQQLLKETMLEFQKHKEAFIQGTQTRAHTGRLVRTARRIYEAILDNHFEHLFPKDYLEDLQFFSSIAGKSTLSKP